MQRSGWGLEVLHSLLLNLSHFNASNWPLAGAYVHVESLHGQPFTLNHCSISK
eukprot:SAG22_NODE_263_length_13359_cov_3.396531_14_plen_53_part_00